MTILYPLENKKPGGILGDVCVDDKEVENLVTSGSHLDLIMMTVLFEEKMA